MKTKNSWRFILPAAVLLVGLGWFSMTAATEPSAPGQEDKKAVEWTIDAVQKAIADLEKRMEQATQTASDETARQMGVSITDVEAFNNKLAMLKTAYLEIITLIAKKEDLTSNSALAREDLEAQEQRGMVRKPPYALGYYDILLQKAAAVDQELETTLNSMDAGKRTLEDLRLVLEDILRELRAQKEKSAASADDDERQAVAWRIGMLEIERELHALLIQSERLKLENLDLEHDAAKLRAQLYQRQIAWVRANLYFDPNDLQQHLVALDEKQQQLTAELQSLIAQKNQADEAYRKALLNNQQTVFSKDLPAAQATLQTRELWRRIYQAAIEQAQEKLRLVAYQRTLWQNRYELLKGDGDAAKIEQWSANTGQHIKKLGRMISAEQAQQAGLMQQIDTLEKHLADKGLEKAEKQQYQEQLRAMQQQIRNRLEYTLDLTSVQSLDRRFLEELAFKQGQKPLVDNLRQTFTKLGHFWEYELWVIDENSVTVRKVIFAIILLFTGLVIAKHLIKRLGRILLVRAQIKKTTAVNIEKLFTYAAYVMVLLLALRLVNIPLAAFAFLGGAVAIGVGFGAQNLINNFISGFIIMGEKPISINDLIEIDGLLGQVEEVGARCTRIRTGENIDILVPNSAFLEKNIINWTHNDTNIRTRVIVGVAYGSPVEEVRKLLLKAVAHIDEIAGTPEPFVLFTDFGDNALIFEVYFWITVRRVIERRMIESRVRFHINTLFNEADIVIAFPQRDIHLHAREPVPVRVQKNE